MAYGYSQASCLGLYARKQDCFERTARCYEALPWLFLLLILVCALCLPVTALAADDPQIQGTAALLVEPETGTVLYEKNADDQRYPAR